MVIRTGGAGGVTSLFVRGGESNYNKVLLDGIPLNEPGGTFNFSNLTTDNLERIEIVRGAQSALFGSDAMASVVQLFTKRRRSRRRSAARRRVGRRRHVRHGPRRRLRVGRVRTLRLLVRRVAASTPTTGAERPLRQHDAVGERRARARRTRRRCASSGAASSSTPARPGQTAFGRPDLDAFFERHDGVGGVTFDQQVTSSFHQRAVLLARGVRSARQPISIADPPYTPPFGNRVAPFEFSDFTFDSRTNLRRHHASYQADWRLTTGRRARGDHRADAAGRLGRRARRRSTIALADTSTPASRDNFGASRPAPGAVARAFVTRRRAHRAQRQLRHGGRAARARSSTWSHEPPAARSARRVSRRAPASASRSRRCCSRSACRRSSAATPTSSRSARAPSKPASSSGSPATARRVDVTWFDNRFRNLIATCTTDPATFAVAVLQHRPDAGARRRARRSKSRRSSVRPRARLYASRFARSSTAPRPTARCSQPGQSAVPPAAPFRIRRASRWTWRAAHRRPQRRRSSAGTSTATSRRCSPPILSNPGLHDVGRAGRRPSDIAALAHCCRSTT